MEDYLPPISREQERGLLVELIEGCRFPHRTIVVHSWPLLVENRLIEGLQALVSSEASPRVVGLSKDAATASPEQPGVGYFDLASHFDNEIEQELLVRVGAKKEGSEIEAWVDTFADQVPSDGVYVPIRGTFWSFVEERLNFTPSAVGD